MQRRSFLFFLVLFLSLFSAGIFADVMQERRLTISASLFPRIIAVDTEISKKLDAAGNIRLALIYSDSKTKAEKISRLMTRKVKKIAGKTIVFSLVDINSPSSLDSEKHAGLFLVQPLSERQIQKAINHSNNNNILLFSPFEGDIERGVMASIFVGAKIRPYFNVLSMKNAGVNLKSGLLKVSKLYE